MPVPRNIYSNASLHVYCGFSILEHVIFTCSILYFRRQLRFRAPGHFCICPVDEIHNFSTFEFSTRFQHRRAREILLKIYKKFNYFRVFVKWIVTILLNVVARRYDIYERSPQSLHIIIFSCEHVLMLYLIFLKVFYCCLNIVWVDKCVIMFARYHG